MLSPGTLKEIVIAGGGTAGWMAAAALSQLTRNGHTTVTLVESDDIPTVGVGEATIPPIQSFNGLLGIDTAAFMRETQATIKLGIVFDGWWQEGQSYIHPFGEYGRDINAVRLLHYWLKLKAMGAPVGSLDDYCLTAVAAREGRFAPPDPDPRTVQSAMAFAYHFDSALYAAFLRRYAEARGVRRIEGRIASVQRHPETGDLTALMLDGDRMVPGQLFLDCTGFRALLLGETLGVPFVDWSHWLPMNRALAVQSQRVSDPVPYTRATARQAGWQWRIPLQHRTGNGHVFCSDHMDEGEAEAILLANLDGPALGVPRRLRFTTGHRRDFWSHNVVGIGLASGFMEPLESTSIHLIQTGITKLVALLPGAGGAAVERDTYNRLTRMQFEQIRDFLILHYKANARSGAFWEHMRRMDVPDTLTQRIDLFRSRGRIMRQEDELFADANWEAVLMGQGIQPERWDPMVDSVEPAAALRTALGMREAVRETVMRLPSHAEFIRRTCAAPAPTHA